MLSTASSLSRLYASRSLTLNKATRMVKHSFLVARTFAGCALPPPGTDPLDLGPALRTKSIQHGSEPRKLLSSTRPSVGHFQCARAAYLPSL